MGRGPPFQQTGHVWKDPILQGGSCPAPFLKTEGAHLARCLLGPDRFRFRVGLETRPCESPPCPSSRPPWFLGPPTFLEDACRREETHRDVDGDAVLAHRSIQGKLC